MILANEVVAAHLHERDFPALYRVHEKPSPDSLAALLPVLSEFSWFNRISLSVSWPAMRMPCSRCSRKAKGGLRPILCRRS